MISHHAKVIISILASTVLISGCEFDSMPEKECYEAASAAMEAIERHHSAIDANKHLEERKAGGDAVVAALKWKDKACK